MQHRGLSSQSLKAFAMVAMLGDHLAWAFLPDSSVAAFGLHTLGAMAMPIFAFFVAEGYHHTRDLRAYMGRMALFALVSYLPFVLFVSRVEGTGMGFDAFFRFNMIYTLLLGLAALALWERAPLPELKVMGAVLLCMAALPGDGIFFPVLLVLVFGLLRREPVKARWTAALIMAGMVAATVLSAPAGASGRELFFSVGYRVGLFLSLGLLSLYNGKRGRGSRWIFYVFYPLHLLILAILMGIAPVFG